MLEKNLRKHKELENWNTAQKKEKFEEKIFNFSQNVKTLIKTKNKKTINLLSNLISKLYNTATKTWNITVIEKIANTKKNNVFN